MICGWGGGWGGKVTKRYKKILVDNGYVCYLSCGPGDFTGVYVYQNLSCYIYAN